MTNYRIAYHNLTDFIADDHFEDLNRKHTNLKQILFTGSLNCLPLSSVNTDEDKIIQLLTYFDSLESEDEYPLNFWKNSKSDVLGFLKYTGFDNFNNASESVILFLSNDGNKISNQDDILILSIDDAVLYKDSYMSFIVNTEPLIIKDGDMAFFSFKKDGSDVTCIKLIEIN